MLWGRRFGGDASSNVSDDQAKYSGIDDLGGIYITEMSASNSIVYDPNPFTSFDVSNPGWADSFLLKFNAVRPGDEVVLFSDSFEIGEWNGLWVEDSQNDWFRSTQRAIDRS